ncbi:MAG: response regulator transcription factor [Bacteroidetes bacterium]|nr:response regulator transcription factor [Bacteroidota bacterium]
MKVVIIEDEKPAARRLTRLLETFELEILTTLHSVDSSVKWLKENKHPDLFFLDIQLSDGLAFEIFEQVPTKSFVIFTTAFDEFALKAFKLNSIDYLLKPIEIEALEQAIAKYKQFVGHYSATYIDFNELKNYIINPNQENYKKRFVVKIGQHFKPILIDDITCFYSQDKNTFLHTRDNRSYPVEFSLDQLEVSLNPVNFFRISRKHIVHINFIKDIISYSNSRLQVFVKNYNENDLIVSREKVTDFKNWLK